MYSSADFNVVMTNKGLVSYAESTGSDFPSVALPDALAHDDGSFFTSRLLQELY